MLCPALSIRVLFETASRDKAPPIEVVINAKGYLALPSGSAPRLGSALIGLAGHS